MFVSVRVCVCVCVFVCVCFCVCVFLCVSNIRAFTPRCGSIYILVQLPE